MNYGLGSGPYCRGSGPKPTGVKDSLKKAPGKGRADRTGAVLSVDSLDLLLELEGSGAARKPTVAENKKKTEAVKIAAANDLAKAEKKPPSRVEESADKTVVGSVSRSTIPTSRPFSIVKTAPAKATPSTPLTIAKKSTGSASSTSGSVSAVASSSSSSTPSSLEVAKKSTPSPASFKETFRQIGSIQDANGNKLPFHLSLRPEVWLHGNKVVSFTITTGDEPGIYYSIRETGLSDFTVERALLADAQERHEEFFRLYNEKRRQERSTKGTGAVVVARPKSQDVSKAKNEPAQNDTVASRNLVELMHNSLMQRECLIVHQRVRNLEKLLLDYPAKNTLEKNDFNRANTEAHIRPYEIEYAEQRLRSSKTKKERKFWESIKYSQDSGMNYPARIDMTLEWLENECETKKTPPDEYLKHLRKDPSKRLRDELEEDVRRRFKEGEFDEDASDAGKKSNLFQDSAPGPYYSLSSHAPGRDIRVYGTIYHITHHAVQRCQEMLESVFYIVELLGGGPSLVSNGEPAAALRNAIVEEMKKRVSWLSELRFVKAWEPADLLNRMLESFLLSIFRARDIFSSVRNNRNSFVDFLRAQAQPVGNTGKSEKDPISIDDDGDDDGEGDAMQIDNEHSILTAGSKELEEYVARWASEALTEADFSQGVEEMTKHSDDILETFAEQRNVDVYRAGQADYVRRFGSKTVVAEQLVHNVCELLVQLLDFVDLAGSHCSDAVFLPISLKVNASYAVELRQQGIDTESVKTVLFGLYDSLTRNKYVLTRAKCRAIFGDVEAAKGPKDGPILSEAKWADVLNYERHRSHLSEPWGRAYRILHLINNNSQKDYASIQKHLLPALRFLKQDRVQQYIRDDPSLVEEFLGKFGKTLDDSEESFRKAEANLRQMYERSNS